MTVTEEDLLVISFEHENKLKVLLGIDQDDGSPLPPEIIAGYKRMKRMADSIRARVDDQELLLLALMNKELIPQAKNLTFGEQVIAKLVQPGTYIIVQYGREEFLAKFSHLGNDLKIYADIQDGSGLQRGINPAKVRVATPDEVNEFLEQLQPA